MVQSYKVENTRNMYKPNMFCYSEMNYISVLLNKTKFQIVARKTAKHQFC